MMTDMYNHHTDSDADSDCEVYFLKPVNEYNIADKIKEANKELFSNVSSEEKDRFSRLIEIDPETIATTTMRKVTFAPNLEDYEPETRTQDTVADIDAEDEPTEETMKIIRFPPISEEEPIQSIQETCKGEQTDAIEKDNVYVSEIIEETPSLSILSHINGNLGVEDVAEYHISDNDEIDDVDEICEEIVVMEMEGGTTATSTTTMTTTQANTFMKADSLRRTITKQDTFDCDDQDNRSLTNLLALSDGEEENSYKDHINSIRIDGFDDIAYNDNDTDGYNNDNDDEEDDDDQLSLIVASYLPDEFKQTIAMSPPSSISTRSNHKSGSYSKGNTGKAKSCKSTSVRSSFGKRFQLRRKAHSTNSIGIGVPNNAITDVDECNSHPNMNLMGTLKLNYKTCCEYRNSIKGKLPKYTGYLSEYGLSREQLEQREQIVQKKQRFVLEQAMKMNEDEMRKMHDNERAFTTWLRNKMRYPINKTRNMFDVKLRLMGKKKPSSGGNNSEGNPNINANDT